jgi:hypothetical protein
MKFFAREVFDQQSPPLCSRPRPRFTEGDAHYKVCSLADKQLPWRFCHTHPGALDMRAHCATINKPPSNQ